MLYVKADQATAARRRVYFDLRSIADGITPETGEAGAQPQISTNGGAWTNTGIGGLTAIGNGRYYADLTTGAVANAGDTISTRYKSANTVDSPGTTCRVVAFDPDDIDSTLTNSHGSGSWQSSAAAGAGAKSVTVTVTDSGANPIADAAVWISTDAAGANVVAGTLRTNDAGQVTFLLDDGSSYYAWRDHADYNFTNPQSFTA